MHVYFPTGYFSGLCFSFSSWDKPWRKDWKLEPSEKTQEKISKIKMKASLSSCQNTREIWESQKKKSTPQCLPEEPRDDCLLISRTWILTAHFTHVVFRVNLASRTSQVAEWMAQNFWVVGGDRGLSRVCFRVRQCLRGWGREWEEGKFLSVGFEGKIRNVYLGSSTPWLTFSPLVWVQ